MHDHPPRIGRRICGLFVALVCLQQGTAAADAPAEALHLRIDRITESARVGPPVAAAKESEFLRRLALDLTGMPPSVEELKEFLADPAADKRARAVDRLLDGPLFARHWAITLDVMLMERRPNVNVTAEEWQSYLLRAARENRPLNQLLGEILSADGAVPKLRPAARFYLDRGSEPRLITRDVGRIFFGRDLQCAQCHNHPIVKDYQQSDYYGLLAFISPGYALTRKEGTKEITFYAEKAGTDLAFDSVFVKNDQHLTGTRIPGGTELAEPVFPPGDEYKVKPADQVLPVPRFSRRARLASLATGGAVREFNENIANRLWAVMMGRGLVHPLDLHHPGNPPSQPELLRLLGDEIAALNFDVKAVLRELALTRAYQRAIDLPAETAGLPGNLAANLAEIKARSLPLEASAERARDDYSRAVKAWHKAEAALVPLVAAADKALLKHSEVAKKQEEAQKAVSDLQARIAASRDTANALAEAAGRAQKVVEKLPKEKELADAARTFANRATAAAAELAALENAIVQKSDATKQAALEVAAAAKSVAAGRAAAQPVRETVRDKEQVTVETRRKMAASRVALEEHRKRVELLAAYSRYMSLKEQAAAIDRAALAGRETVVEAKNRVTDHERSLQHRQDEAKAADLALFAAKKARADAQSALDRHHTIAKGVATALAATEAALRLLPADLALSEAAAKLKAKSDLLKTVPADVSAHIDAGLAAEKSATHKLSSAKQAHSESRAEQTRRASALAAAQAAQVALVSRVKALRSEFADATSELTTLLGNYFAVAQLKPLSPEQMCWSMLKVTGVYDRQLLAEAAELNESKPLTGPAANDPALKRARASDLEQRTFDKLKANVAAFIAVYAAGPGQPQNDFFATADQALFAANGGLINSWIAPAGGNVSQRMVEEKDGKKAALDLYLTILSRPPTSEESADVARVLAVPPSGKPAAILELVWGLLTSAEFRFNH